MELEFGGQNDDVFNVFPKVRRIVSRVLEMQKAIGKKRTKVFQKETDNIINKENENDQHNDQHNN